jgi:rhodanese-related sulfurtransferase
MIQVSFINTVNFTLKDMNYICILFKMQKLIRYKGLWVSITLIAITVGILNKKEMTARVQSKPFQAMLYLLLDHSVTEISVSKLSKLEQDVTILDVREENEYKVSHIENSKNVAYSSFNIEAITDIDKNDKVVIYCSLGKRSENIAKQMVDAGYTNVNNLYGGIFEWKNQGNPVFVDANETNKIHAYDKVFGIWLNKGEKVFD